MSDRKSEISTLSTDDLVRQLVELQENPDALVDPTVKVISAELETLAQGLVQPHPQNRFENESECLDVGRRVEQLGQNYSLGLDSNNGDVGAPSGPAVDLGALGQYQLLRKLGEGGMGAVYKALHTRLDKLVALKVLPFDKVEDPIALV